MLHSTSDYRKRGKNGAINCHGSCGVAGLYRSSRVRPEQALELSYTSRFDSSWSDSFAGSSMAMSTNLHRMVCVGGRRFDSFPANHVLVVGNGFGGTNARVAQLVRAPRVSTLEGWRFDSSLLHRSHHEYVGFGQGSLNDTHKRDVRALRALSDDFDQGRVAQCRALGVKNREVGGANPPPATRWCIVIPRERSSAGQNTESNDLSGREFKSRRSHFRIGPRQGAGK